MHPSVNELIASRRCAGDDRKVVLIGDSGQKGTDVYWCETIGQWVCVDLEAGAQTVTAEEIAESTGVLLFALLDARAHLPQHAPHGLHRVNRLVQRHAVSFALPQIHWRVALQPAALLNS
jgi:hypothetical protein